MNSESEQETYGLVSNFTLSWDPPSFKEILANCNNTVPVTGWLVLMIGIVFTGLLTNSGLLWLLLRGRQAMTASKVLGLNLAALDVIYLLMLPLGIYADNYHIGQSNSTSTYGAQTQTQNQTQNQNQTLLYFQHQNQSSSYSQNQSQTQTSPYSQLQINPVSQNRSQISSTFQTHSPPNDLPQANILPFVIAGEAFSMLNLLGCPLLLTCMCVERYLAAAQPILYLRLRKPEYRVACCTVVWIITLAAATFTACGNSIHKTIIPLAVIMSGLFLTMLACLCGVVGALCRPSPAHTGGEAQPLRTRAARSVLLVLGPTSVAYVPIVALTLLLFLVQCQILKSNEGTCYSIKLLISFPIFGVYIGPMFYVVKAREVICVWKGRGKNK